MIANMEAEHRGPTAEQELKSLLDVNVAVSRHLERDELFGAIASCLRKIVETDRFGIEAVQPPCVKHFTKPGVLRAMLMSLDKRCDCREQGLSSGKSIGFG